MGSAAGVLDRLVDCVGLGARWSLGRLHYWRRENVLQVGVGAVIGLFAYALLLLLKNTGRDT